MPEQIERLGKIFGNEKGANKLIEFYNKNLNEVKKRVAKVKNKKTIYWEYGDPYTTAIPGTSNDGWVNMMRVAGGINIFDDPGIKGKTIDPEKILLEDPDLIMKTTSGAAYKNTGVYTAPSEEEYKNIMNEMINRSGWKDLKAVKHKNVYITTGFCSGGLGKLIGVIYTAKWLYPEEMKGMDPDKVFEEWMDMQGVKTPKGHVYKLKLMNPVKNIHQYNSKKILKIVIALFILLFVSYISVFTGIANINLKRVLATIFEGFFMKRNLYHKEKW